MKIYKFIKAITSPLKKLHDLLEKIYENAGVFFSVLIIFSIIFFTINYWPPTIGNLIQIGLATGVLFCVIYYGGGCIILPMLFITAQFTTLHDWADNKIRFLTANGKTKSSKNRDLEHFINKDQDVYNSKCFDFK